MSEKLQSQLHTPRLLLRQWRDTDLVPFAAMNRDPAVMEYFPDVLDEDQSRRLLERIRRHFAQYGWGLWAVEERDGADFIGFVGLLNVSDALPFAPAVEAGWRLARPWWGKGYATEAGREVLRFAFHDLQLDDVVSFTARSNLRSRAVMERLGLRNTGRNFPHPMVPKSSELREHVLYALHREDWRASRLDN